VLKITILGFHFMFFLRVLR